MTEDEQWCRLSDWLRSRGFATRRIPRAPQQGKTPDGWLLKDDDEVALFEIKHFDGSVENRRMFEDLDADGFTRLWYRDNDHGGAKAFRAIRDAVAQFDSFDPLHRFPRILAIVANDWRVDFGDIESVVTGRIRCDGGVSLPFYGPNHWNYLAISTQLDGVIWSDVRGERTFLCFLDEGAKARCLRGIWT